MARLLRDERPEPPGFSLQVARFLGERLGQGIRVPLGVGKGRFIGKEDPAL
jgi:hypothetical protein